MIRSWPIPLFLLAACGSAPQSSDSAARPDTRVPWSGGHTPAGESISIQRDLRAWRSIVHLHSPWSHDACDGDPIPDGAPNESCLVDLRDALCANAIDYAFLTDHPSHAAAQPFADLFHAQPGDTLISGDRGQPIAMQYTCSGANAGHVVTWRAGIEDELMPVGLDAHIAGDDHAENDRLYNEGTVDAVLANQAVGGTVLLAHTEGRDPDAVLTLVEGGLQGLELFNLHAMFDPTIRREDLGLEAMDWLQDIAPFTDAEGTAEPDLLFLAVLQPQPGSVATWDAANAVAQVTGVAGTDAHQNVLPMILRDGDRVDSYRRMTRWFSNFVLAPASATPTEVESALDAGRNYVAFEILGTPTAVDFHLESADGTIYEMGDAAPVGTLHVGCPTLTDDSPRGLDSPEITVTVLKDGQEWANGCGTFVVEASGVYRLRVDMVPRHLADFLGEAPEAWMKRYPWVYTNPVRVGLEG